MTSYCNNCGKHGHQFHQCKSPITSHGIIAFRENPLKNNVREYLLIRRKDTLGYVDFMRGKYSIYNKKYILNMIKQMTNDEKWGLITQPFSKLWNDLWGTFIVDDKPTVTNAKKPVTSINDGLIVKQSRTSVPKFPEETTRYHYPTKLQLVGANFAPTELSLRDLALRINHSRDSAFAELTVEDKSSTTCAVNPPIVTLSASLIPHSTIVSLSQRTTPTLISPIRSRVCDPLRSGVLAVTEWSRHHCVSVNVVELGYSRSERS